MRKDTSLDKRFKDWRLAFTVRRSAFGVRRSAFGVRRSAFGVRRSAFGVRRFVLGVCQEAAPEERNIYSHRRSNSGVAP